MRSFVRLSRLASLLLLALCASCSGFRAFQHTVTQRGGHDGAGGADQIYFELRNVKGPVGGGLCALMLPADWPDRPTVVVEEGNGEYSLALDPQVGPEWTTGSGIEPEVSLGRQKGEWGGELRIHGRKHSPLQVGVFESPSRLRRSTGDASSRLSAGASAYALVDDSPEETSTGGRRDYRLFGARLDAEGEVEWVQLLGLHFEDSRGGVARTLDVPFRQIQIFEAALYMAAIVWPVFLL